MDIQEQEQTATKNGEGAQTLKTKPPLSRLITIIVRILLVVGILFAISCIPKNLKDYDEKFNEEYNITYMNSSKLNLVENVTYTKLSWGFFGTHKQNANKGIVVVKTDSFFDRETVIMQMNETILALMGEQDLINLNLTSKGTKHLFNIVIFEYELIRY